MDTVYQLWGLAPECADWDTMTRRLKKMQYKHPAKAVVCGLNAPNAVYQEIRSIVSPSNTQVFLWFPMFSELDYLKPYDPLRDWESKAYLEDVKPNGFHFRCPSSVGNMNAVLSESSEHLDKGTFDGVFLDRIRYPSFQFGLSGVLGCFCPSCCEQYHRLGLVPERLIDACERVNIRVQAHENNPLQLIAFDGSHWQIQDTDLQSLLNARCQIITESVLTARTFFAKQGLRIGLDLFTPALSYFVGQCFSSLVPLADFVKPMLYMHTDAPAGLGFELSAMNQALGGHGAEPLLSMVNASGLEEFARGEIRRMMFWKKERRAETKIYCGLEYNRLLPTPQITPDTIIDTLDLFRAAGAKGVMPSWNLISTPDENVTALIEYLSKH